jgi:hypothetical protein
MSSHPENNQKSRGSRLPVTIDASLLVSYTMTRLSMESYLQELWI